MLYLETIPCLPKESYHEFQMIIQEKIKETSHRCKRPKRGCAFSFLARLMKTVTHSSRRSFFFSLQPWELFANRRSGRSSDSNNQRKKKENAWFAPLQTNEHGGILALLLLSFSFHEFPLHSSLAGSWFSFSLAVCVRTYENDHWERRGGRHWTDGCWKN